MVPAKKPDIQPCVNVDSRAIVERDRDGVHELTTWLLKGQLQCTEG